VAGWKRWTVALITLVVGAAVVVLALFSPGGLESAARIGALIVGLAPLALSVVVWARRRPTISTVEGIDAAGRPSNQRVWVGVVPPRADGFRDRGILGPVPATVKTSSDQAGTAVVLSGSGGVGKTQLAAEQARVLWRRGAVDVLVWVAARTREAIVSGYAAAITELTGGDTDAERAARRWLAWLAATDRTWLLVLDDVQDPADLRGLWPPQTRSGQVLVTTRRRDAALRGDQRQVIEVGLFTSDEAEAFLLHRLSHCAHQAAGASRLAAALGYLPLALSHAAAYIADHPALTCASYLRLFTEQRATLRHLFPEPGCVPDDYQHTVATTWTLSRELANHLAPAGLAGPLLDVVSVLDPNGMPDRIFGASAVLDHLSAAVGRKVDSATEVLSCLHRLNLVTHDPTTPHHAVRVHALVQRAIRETLAPDQLTAATHAAADALLDVWPDVDCDTTLAAVLRANTASLTGVGNLRRQPGVHPLLFRAGASLGESGQVAAAACYYHQLAVDVQHELGADHLDTLAIRHEFADWHGESGDPAGAAAAFEGLLTDRQRVLGPDHRCTLATRHEIARWHGESGDPAGAITRFHQLLTDDLRILGPDDRDTLTTRHNLVYWQGRAGLQVNLVDLQHLLADRLRVLGPDHPDTFATRHHVARWHGETGDPAGAAAALQDLFVDRLRVLGPDHPDTLATRHELACWHGEAGAPATAANLLRDLFTDRLRVLGPDHPDTLATRHHLARWHGETGDPAGAAAALQDLLRDKLSVLGPTHPLTLTTRADLHYWQRRTESRNRRTQAPAPPPTVSAQFGASSVVAMRRSGR
jgi:hypothetical protein